MNSDAIKQLTELRDALRGYRSEQELLKDFMGFYISDMELKEKLIADDVVRALWYCLCNSNAEREKLIDKLFHYFTVKHKVNEAPELISMLLFLGGVDYQLNPIKMSSQTQTTDDSSDYHGGVQLKPRKNYSINHKWLITFGVVFCVLIGTIVIVRSCHKDPVIPEGSLIGTVVSAKGTIIQLWEHLHDGVYSIEAFSKKKNGKYAEEKIFKNTSGVLSSIISVKYNKWINSNPQDGLFAFNENDKSLYVPHINKDLTGADRYNVYQFDGNNFICTITNSAGYWLHPSLQDFDSLFAVGRTNKVLVRIDYVKNGFRYAAWNRDKTMKDEPDLILYNDGKIEDDKIVFNNTSYKYIFDYGTNNLWIYNGKKALQGSHNMEILTK